MLNVPCLRYKSVETSKNVVDLAETFDSDKTMVENLKEEHRENFDKVIHLKDVFRFANQENGKFAMR